MSIKSVSLAAPGANIYKTLPNYGAGTVFVDKLAPGTQVAMSERQSDGVELTGSGMATALVTGAVALFRAARPELSPAEVKEKLFGGAETPVTLDQAMRNVTTDSAAGSTEAAKKLHTKMMIVDGLAVNPYVSVLPEVSTSGLGANLSAWTSSSPVTVAVLDSGADTTHPALQGYMAPGSAPNDELGSGTHVAGIIIGH